MKEMKGRFLKKLKLLSTINSLKLSHHKNLKALRDDEDFELESSDVILTEEKPIQEVEQEAEEDEYPVSLTDFKEKCPPGGERSIVFYTTTLRGIRKTFEDCSTIRFLLESFKVKFNERDVSLHLEYRDELWELMNGRVIPPRLFIKGRYIGGADEVVGLHEQGKLKKLLEGMPKTLGMNSACDACGKMRFVVCSNCNGSRKILKDGDEDDGETVVYIRCPECNENGLVKCPICCLDV